MKRHVLSRLVGCLLLAPLLLALCASSSYAQLGIRWFTIDNGGFTYSGSGGLRLGGTIGQPDAGWMSGPHLNLSGGFWRGGDIASSVPGGPDEPSDDPGIGLPEELRIVAGMKNPFRYETGILLELPEPEAVVIRVFDHSGRQVREIASAVMPAGHHRLAWDGRSSNGRRVASGVYLLQVRAGDQSVRSRVVLLR